MKSFRFTLVAAILVAASSSMAPAQSSHISKPTQAAGSPAGLHDFDFLIGEWSVHHRKLKANSDEWIEFDGTCSNRTLMKGQANMEEHMLNSPSGAYRAIALRSYDSKSGDWAIWWLDERYPAGPLDPPVQGHFESGVGTFYSDYINHGKPERVRFIWSHITPTSARWEQALSHDAGKTWKTNWVMEFRRKVDPGASAGQAQSRVNWGVKSDEQGSGTGSCLASLS